MLLGRLQERCNEIDADLVAFVLPHLHDRYLYDPRWPVPEEVALPGEGDEFQIHGSRRLAEAGAAYGFATLSVDQALLAASRAGTNLDCGDEHLNAAGNRILADELAAALQPLLAGD